MKKLNDLPPEEKKFLTDKYHRLWKKESRRLIAEHGEIPGTASLEFRKKFAEEHEIELE